MARKEKKQRTKNFQFFVLNIKLQSEHRTGKTAYEEIFNTAFKQKKIGQIRGEIYGIIRQLVNLKGSSYMYGLFCRFVKVDDRAMNLDNLEIEDFQIPKNLFLNPQEAEFIFYPELHRVAVRKSSSISPQSLIKMLAGIFREVIAGDESIEISLQQSADGFLKIINAKQITNLHIEVSPTNADLNPEDEQFIDDELKIMKAAKVVADIKPTPEKNLVFEKSRLLGGMLGMAQSNGYAKATIINQEDKRETVCTTSHPERFSITSVTFEETRDLLYNQLKKRFRR